MPTRGRVARLPSAARSGPPSAPAAAQGLAAEPRAAAAQMQVAGLQAHPAHNLRAHSQVPVWFCSRCGSRLFNRAQALPGQTVLMVASLDPEPTNAPVAHMNVESKAPWFEIRDDRPQFDGFPPAVQKAMDRSKGKV